MTFVLTTHVLDIFWGKEYGTSVSSLEVRVGDRIVVKEMKSATMLVIDR